MLLLLLLLLLLDDDSVFSRTTSRKSEYKTWNKIVSTFTVLFLLVKYAIHSSNHSRVGCNAKDNTNRFRILLAAVLVLSVIFSFPFLF